MRLPSLGTPLPRTTAWRETSGFQFPKGGRRSSRSWRALTVHLLIPRRDSGNRHLARHGGVLFVLNPDLGWAAALPITLGGFPFGISIPNTKIERANV